MPSNAISGNTYGTSADIALISDATTVLRKAFNPSDNKTAWENFADFLGSLAYVTAEGAGFPANASRKFFKAIETGDIGYLINTTWGEILEDRK